MSLPALFALPEKGLNKLSHKKALKLQHGSAGIYSKKTAKQCLKTNKKKTADAEARAAKEREERLVKLYDLWLQVKQEEREEQNQYFKERVHLQHELIQKQDLLYKHKQSKINSRLHKIKEERRLTKLAQSKHYSDFVRDEIAKEKRLASTLKSHTRVISSHQPFRIPFTLSDTPTGNNSFNEPLDKRSIIQSSDDGTTGESSLLSDNFSELMNESVEVQLQMLLGSEALDFLKPTFREGAKKALDPLIEKYKGTGAHQLWGILRGKSNKKLEQEDGKIPIDLKSAYRSFLRECLHADLPVVERNFCKSEDMVPEPQITESHLIKDINFARHRLDLMYRVAHMNKDKTRLLFKNMESADPKEGSVRPPRYKPDQIKEPKVASVSLPHGKSESLGEEVNTEEATAAGKNEEQPFILGGDKISFLTEKMAECKGEFSKRHKAAGFANDNCSTQKQETKKQYSIRGTASAPISSQEQRKIKHNSVKSWQPLSVDALLEYKTRVDVLGSGDFLHGKPKTWKMKETIAEEP